MLISAISGFLLLIFGISYIYKLYILKRDNKINANVLGKGEKAAKEKSTENILKATTVLWLFLWLFNIITGSNSAVTALKVAGLLITAAGVLFFELAIVYMKTSWRVGIDRTAKTELIRDGIYRYSRNPAFVGFDMMFIGFFLTFPDFYTFVVMCVNLITIHLQIRQEERFLQASFGDKYVDYRKKTPRYLMF